MWKGDTYNLGPVWGKEKGKGEKENRNRGICRIRKKKKRAEERFAYKMLTSVASKPLPNDVTQKEILFSIVWCVHLVYAAVFPLLEV